MQIPTNKFTRVEGEKKKRPSQTNLEKEQEARRKSAEAVEKLLISGGDSEKEAAKLIKAEHQEWEKKYWDRKVNEANELQSKIRLADRKVYLLKMAEFLTAYLDEIRAPSFLEVGVLIDAEKNTLAGAFRDRKGRMWSAGFYVQFRPDLDVLCIDQIAFKLENGIDAVQGKFIDSGGKRIMLDERGGWSRILERSDNPKGVIVPK